MRTASDKIRLFRQFFTGLNTVYGTYDPETGHAWQVKKPVTDDTFLAHLSGRRPYGVSSRMCLTNKRALDAFTPLSLKKIQT